MNRTASSYRSLASRPRDGTSVQIASVMQDTPASEGASTRMGLAKAQVAIGTHSKATVEIRRIIALRLRVLVPRGGPIILFTLPRGSIRRMAPDWVRSVD